MQNIAESKALSLNVTNFPLKKYIYDPLSPISNALADVRTKGGIISIKLRNY